MNLENITLVITAVINLIMSVLVLLRGQKNKANTYFSIMTFFVFIWAMTLLLARTAIDLAWLSFWDRSTYVMAIAIIISLLYFVVYFPYQSNTLKKIEKILIWIPAIVLTVLIYTKFFITGFAVGDRYTYISYFYKPFFIFYAIYFIMIVVMAIYRLWRKYINAEIIFKKQLKWLLLVFIVCLAFGFYIDLVLEYMGNFNYIWLGPVPTVIMNITVFYFIYSSRDKIHG